MPNYCSKCGNKIEPGAKFCPYCGTKLEAQPPSKPAPSAGGGILESLDIEREDLVGQWEARIDVDYSTGLKGLLLLTKDEVLFVREGTRLEKLKKSWRVPISRIKWASKLPLSSHVQISLKAPEGGGLMRKLVEQRERMFKIKDPKSFIEKLKQLNPNIK